MLHPLLFHLKHLYNFWDNALAQKKEMSEQDIKQLKEKIALPDNFYFTQLGVQFLFPQYLSEQWLTDEERTYSVPWEIFRKSGEPVEKLIPESIQTFWRYE